MSVKAEDGVDLTEVELVSPTGVKKKLEKTPVKQHFGLGKVNLRKTVNTL